PSRSGQGRRPHVPIRDLAPWCGPGRGTEGAGMGERSEMAATRRWPPVLLAAATAAAAVVGLLDAVFTDEHDLAVLFGLASAGAAALTVLALARPVAVAPRP